MNGIEFVEHGLTSYVERTGVNAGADGTLRFAVDFKVMGKFVKWNMRKDVVPLGTLRMDRESRWGNPYSRDDRMENIKDHMEYLRKEWRRDKKTRDLMLDMARKIKVGEDVNVSCWCHPLPCHLDNWEKAVFALIEKGLV